MEDRRPHKATIELSGASEADLVDALLLLASWALEGKLNPYVHMGANGADGSSFELKLEYRSNGSGSKASTPRGRGHGRGRARPRTGLL